MQVGGDEVPLIGVPKMALNKSLQRTRGKM